MKQINLVEISFVQRPMNPLAEIETVKSLNGDPMANIPVFESVMDEMYHLARDLRR